MDPDPSEIEHLESRNPGEDPEDPYEDVNLADLPEWWRRAIEEFDAHGLRPYRPPRLEDGTLLHEVVESIESTHDVTLFFGTTEESFREEWAVHLDGSRIGSIGHHRSPSGYSVFEIDADELRSMIGRALE